MALKFEGKHHRNPSGLHAKVNWLIQESKWDLAKIENLYKKVCINISHLSEDNEIDWKSAGNSLNSWDKAISICEFIITGSVRPSYKKIKLDDIKNKHWFIKLKDYYDTYISNEAITKEYFI